LPPTEHSCPVRTTAGKAPIRLAQDPKYTQGGSRINPTPPNESHKTITQTLESSTAAKWQAAMQRELGLLAKYGVYEVIDTVPPGAKVIDTK